MRVNERRCRGEATGHLEELALDDVADHLRVDIGPEELGVDIVTGGRDEGEQGPGEDTGHRQRKSHRPEGGEPVGIRSPPPR